MKGTFRILGVAAAAALIMAATATTASADLIHHMKIAGQADYGGSVIVDGPGDTIDVEAWVEITGGSGDGEAFVSGAYRLWSSDGGPVLGDYAGWEIPEWTLQTDFFGDPIPGSYKGGNTPGTPADLDGDGDTDWGASPTNKVTDTSNGTSWVTLRDPLSGPPLAFGDEHQIGHGQWEVTGLDLASRDAVELAVDASNMAPFIYSWFEDMTPQSYPDNGGAPPVATDAITVLLASTADAGSVAGAQVVDPETELVLDGSAATGSINWWRWEFDGDGDYTGEGDPDLAIETGDPVTVLTMADLDAMGLGMGMHEVTMTVGWVQSPAENVDTSDSTTFEIVPEPATLALVGLGLAALARRKRQ